MSPIDATLLWITSDIGSIVLGGVGLVLLLVGRLVLDDEIVQDGSNLVVQTRVNLLAVLAIGAVLLNGLSQLDVQTALAEQVELQGSAVRETVIRILPNEMVLDENSQEVVKWALDSLCAATPAGTAVLLVATDMNNTPTWEPLAYRGVLPPNLLLDKPKLPESTPIMDRFRKLSIAQEAESSSTVLRQESYLPTLQALPGKTEFLNFVLPANTQAALLIPTVLNGGRPQEQQQRAVILLGSNQARSFTPQNVAWCQAVATRLEQ